MWSNNGIDIQHRKYVAGSSAGTLSRYLLIPFWVVVIYAFSHIQEQYQFL